MNRFQYFLLIFCLLIFSLPLQARESYLGEIRSYHCNAKAETMRSGTGVLLKKDNTFRVFTSEHVIYHAGAEENICHEFYYRTVTVPLDLVSVNYLLGVASLKAQGDAFDGWLSVRAYEWVTFASPVDLQLGQEVEAIGYPSGTRSQRLSKGSVTSLESKLHFIPGLESVVVTDAKVTKGMSGGIARTVSGQRIFGFLSHEVEFDDFGREPSIGGQADTDSENEQFALVIPIQGPVLRWMESIWSAAELESDANAGEAKVSVAIDDIRVVLDADRELNSESMIFEGILLRSSCASSEILDGGIRGGRGEGAGRTRGGDGKLKPEPSIRERAGEIRGGRGDGSGRRIGGGRGNGGISGESIFFSRWGESCQIELSLAEAAQWDNGAWPYSDLLELGPIRAKLEQGVAIRIIGLQKDGMAYGISPILADFYVLLQQGFEPIIVNQILGTDQSATETEIQLATSRLRLAFTNILRDQAKGISRTPELSARLSQVLLQLESRNYVLVREDELVAITELPAVRNLIMNPKVNFDDVVALNAELKTLIELLREIRH